MESILEKITKIFTNLPNLGPKSAKRIVVHLANKKNTLNQLINLLNYMKDNINNCYNCNNLCENKLCDFCNSSLRNNNLICIVDNVLNLYSIENTNQYNGIYYILNEDSTLNEEKLINLINDGEEKECIIALSSTLEGQAKSYYLQALLSEYKNVHITSLSVGIPMGSDLDYLDTGTLSMAINFRKNI